MTVQTTPRKIAFAEVLPVIAAFRPQSYKKKTD
jgi:hypothetical protein